jgi:hypothetical protein
MSKRWQWALLVPYVAVLAYLLWQRHYILLQVASSLVFSVQGAWILWRHYTQRACYSVAQVRWAGWVNLCLGPLMIGLAWHVTAAEQRIAEQRAVAQPQAMGCNGMIWQGHGRPPDECGADALRPWQPAPMQRVPEPAGHNP